MEGVVMCGAWDVVSFKWLLESHHGMPLAQQINLLLFTRSLKSSLFMSLTELFTDCHSN